MFILTFISFIALFSYYFFATVYSKPMLLTRRLIVFQLYSLAFFYALYTASIGRNMAFPHHYKLSISNNPISSTNIAIWHPVSGADGFHTWCGRTRVHLKGTPDHQVFSGGWEIDSQDCTHFVTKTAFTHELTYQTFCAKGLHPEKKEKPKRNKALQRDFNWQWQSQELDIESIIIN